jgi:hypothetical protein
MAQRSKSGGFFSPRRWSQLQRAAEEYRAEREQAGTGGTATKARPARWHILGSAECWETLVRYGITAVPQARLLVDFDINPGFIDRLRRGRQKTLSRPLFARLLKALPRAVRPEARRELLASIFSDEELLVFLRQVLWRRERMPSRVNVQLPVPGFARDGTLRWTDPDSPAFADQYVRTYARLRRRVDGLFDGDPLKGVSVSGDPDYTEFAWYQILEPLLNHRLSGFAQPRASALSNDELREFVRLRADAQRIVAAHTTGPDEFRWSLDHARAIATPERIVTSAHRERARRLLASSGSADGGDRVPERAGSADEETVELQAVVLAVLDAVNDRPTEPGRREERKRSRKRSALRTA